MCTLLLYRSFTFVPTLFRNSLEAGLVAQKYCSPDSSEVLTLRVGDSSFSVTLGSTGMRENEVPGWIRAIFECLRAKNIRSGAYVNFVWMISGFSCQSSMLTHICAKISLSVQTT